jgi:putative addiction module component (TIGR02574 family)
MSILRRQIDSLSAEEKVELLEAVWESIEADASSLTEAQRAELDRRIARHEQNPSDVIPWGASPQRPLQEAVTLRLEKENGFGKARLFTLRNGRAAVPWVVQIVGVFSSLVKKIEGERRLLSQTSAIGAA